MTQPATDGSASHNSASGGVSLAATAAFPSVPTPDPSASGLCLELGWVMQRLYRSEPWFVIGGDPQKTGQLPGLSKLNREDRTQLEFRRVRRLLGQITGVSWDDAQPGRVDAVHTALAAMPHTTTTRSDIPAEASDFHAAVLELHVGLLSATHAAGNNLGKAYNLGRALADTMRASQTEHDLVDSFALHRTTQLTKDLRDLASVLPPHAAKAVVMSLTRWRCADDLPAGTTHHQQLLDAMPRQGELWRLVLAGEKQPLDLLNPQDYIDAGQWAVGSLRKLGIHTMKAAPGVVALVVGALTLTFVVVLCVIVHTPVSGGGKLTAFLVAVAGWVTSLARTVGPHVRTVAKAAEGPLWQASLDYVVAEAISLPPVGIPDRLTQPTARKQLSASNRFSGRMTMVWRRLSAMASRGSGVPAAAPTGSCTASTTPATSSPFPGSTTVRTPTADDDTDAAPGVAFGAREGGGQC